MDTLKSILKPIIQFVTFFGAFGIWLIKRWGSHRTSFKSFVIDRQLTHPVWFQFIVGSIVLWLLIWVLRLIF